MIETMKPGESLSLLDLAGGEEGDRARDARASHPADESLGPLGGPDPAEPSSQRGPSDEMAATRMPARVAAIVFSRGAGSPAARRGFGGCQGGASLATLSAVEQGSVVFDETLVEEQDEELWHDDDDSTVATAGSACGPTPSRARPRGCTYVADFMTAAHLILVWEEQDDPNLLRHAARARDVGRNPRIVGYRADYGPSASYYAWIAAGRPVHGVRAS